MASLLRYMVKSVNMDSFRIETDHILSVRRSNVIRNAGGFGLLQARKKGGEVIVKNKKSSDQCL
jgi:hypothetical protein